MSAPLPNSLPEPEVRTIEQVLAVMPDFYGEGDAKHIEAFYVYRFHDIPDSYDPYEAGLVIEKQRNGLWYVCIGRAEYNFDDFEQAVETLRDYAVAEGYLIDPAEVYRDALVDVLASAFIFDANGVGLYPGMANIRLDRAVDPETTALIGRLRPLVQARKAGWASEDET